MTTLQSGPSRNYGCFVDRSKKFLYFPKPPGRLWGSPSLLSNGIWGSLSPGVRAAMARSETHASFWSLRMSRTIPVLWDTALRLTHGQLTNLMSLVLLFHYLLLNMFQSVSTSIFRSLQLIVDLFHVLYCFSSMCVGVTVWFGWVVWYPYAGWSTSASACIWIPHHPSRTTTLHQYTSNRSNTTHEINPQ
jgi:hypothetical protein